MKTVLALATVVFAMAAGIANAQVQSMPTEGGVLIVELSTIPTVPVPGEVTFDINFVNPTTQDTQVHIDYHMDVAMDGVVYGSAESHTAEGRVKIPIPLEDEGAYDVNVTVSGIFFNPITPQSAAFAVNVGGDAAPPQTGNGAPATDNGGGCLIATAAYGTEMAGQVQMLREIRDNVLLQTSSGAAFVSAFNDIYYTFSPAVADLERQSPEFQAVVRTLVTPMVATLSIMSLVDGGSDYQVLGLGLAVIALNLGMYAGVPILAVFVTRRYIH